MVKYPPQRTRSFPKCNYNCVNVIQNNVSFLLSHTGGHNARVKVWIAQAESHAVAGENAEAKKERGEMF